MSESGQKVHVPQDRETGVQTYEGAGFSCRFAYARSADTRAADDVGQDYLVFREEESHFVFALCDGVSQSFYGDLAARYLGEALVVWLERELPPTMETEEIGGILERELYAWTTPASETVQRHPLPKDIPPMLRDVLEEKRALGSEAMFIGGRIDLPGEVFPRGRIVLVWMGDSRLRLWDADGRPADLGGRFETAQRWSTRQGPVGGKPNVFVGVVKRKGRRFLSLRAYSDGLGILDDLEVKLPDRALQSLISQAGGTATSDDISFLEIWPGPIPRWVKEDSPASVSIFPLPTEKEEKVPVLTQPAPVPSPTPPSSLSWPDKPQSSVGHYRDIWIGLAVVMGITAVVLLGLVFYLDLVVLCVWFSPSAFFFFFKQKTAYEMLM